MILIATFGSRSRWERKSSRRSTNNSVGSPAVGVRGAALAVEHRDLAEQVARAHEIQRQPAAVGGAGLDPDLAAADPEQGIAGVALLEQHLAGREMLGVAEAGDPLQFVGAQVREHRVHFQNDRKFGLFTHCIAFQIDPARPRMAVARFSAVEVCHKSHNFAEPRIIFSRFERFPLSGISSPDRPRRLRRRRIRCRCPVWNVDMRALKITGAAIAAVIVVLALLLVIGDSLRAS